MCLWNDSLYRFIYFANKHNHPLLYQVTNERALTLIIHHIHHAPMILRLRFYNHLLSISDAGNSLYLLNYIQTWLVTVHYAMEWPNEQEWKSVEKCSHYRWANSRKLIEGDVALCRLNYLRKCWYWEMVARTLPIPLCGRLLSVGTRVLNSVD